MAQGVRGSGAEGIIGLEVYGSRVWDVVAWV